jgi:hypothetical protein
MFQGVMNIKCRREAGGILIRSVLVVCTLITIGVLIVGIISIQQKKQRNAHRKALQISEYGLQIALQKLQKEPSWREGLPKTSYREGWYRIKIQPDTTRDTLLLNVMSEGHMGSYSITKTGVVRMYVMDNDTFWVQNSFR